MRTQHQSMSSSPTKDLRSVPIFELSEEELRERPRPAYEKIRQESDAISATLRN